MLHTAAVHKVSGQLRGLWPKGQIPGTFGRKGDVEYARISNLDLDQNTVDELLAWHKKILLDGTVVDIPQEKWPERVALENEMRDMLAQKLAEAVTGGVAPNVALEVMQAISATELAHPDLAVQPFVAPQDAGVIRG